MFKYLVVCGLVAIARCAPAAEQPASLPANVELKTLDPLREFLILTPEAQLQLQPAFKLQRPVIQPLALYGSATRQADVQNICTQIQQGAETFQQVFPFPLPFLETDNGDEKLKSEKQQQTPELDAETIPVSKIPATVVPQHRFYTVAGRPQFFGNVDILQNPYHPIFSLQPLQAIKSRSVVDPQGQLIGQNNPDSIRVIAGSELSPASVFLRPNENLQGEQIQVALADEVAQQFAKNVAAKQQENQQIVETNAGNLAAQNFASRFGGEQIQVVLADEVTQQFAKNVAEKQQENQKIVETNAGNLVAQNFASRFGGEPVVEQQNQEAAVKFVNVEASHIRNENLAVSSSNENVAEVVQPKVKIVESDLKEAVN